MGAQVKMSGPQHQNEISTAHTQQMLMASASQKQCNPKLLDQNKLWLGLAIY